jgi:hypothetical protein
MPYCVAQRLRFPFAGALLVCVVLFLSSGLLASFQCCGDSMGFPYLCLGIFLSLFSIVAFVYCSTREKGNVTCSPAASRRLFQRLADRVFSDYFRGGFFVTLLLSTTLVLLGAALLFSLSLSFTWSALALGCLSALGGPGILLLGRHRP